MAETKIEWTARRNADGSTVPGYTFNSWIGCTKVSEACRHCYAERDMVRRDMVSWGPEGTGGTRVVPTNTYWSGPRGWAQKAFEARTRPLVFCASLADVG